MVAFTPAISYTSFCISIAAYVAWHLRKPRCTRNAIPSAQTSSRLPYIGQLLEYGADPLRFILKQKNVVGEVFRLDLVFMNITFLIGAKVSFSQSHFSLRNHLTLVLSSGTVGYSRTQQRLTLASRSCFLC